MAEVNDVVKVLIKDGPLLENWSSFYDSLDLPIVEKVPLQVRVNRSEPLQPIFADTLKLWVDAENERSVQYLANILDHDGHKRTAGVLRREYGDGKILIRKPPRANETCSSPNTFKTAKPISFGLNPPVESFTGRVSELDQLRLWFTGNKLLLKVTGMGGIGKTQLARRFAWEKSERFSCIWLIGESQQTLKNSITTFCEETNIQVRNAQGQQRNTVDLFKEAFDKTQFRLLVIDNVEEGMNEGILKLLTPLKGRDCSVLVTSRDNTVISMMYEIIPLVVFTDGEVHGLVSQLLSQAKPQEILDLSHALGNYPLALQQAIGYIREQVNVIGGYSIQHYLKDFETIKSIRLLGHKLDQFYDDYEMSTLLTWQITNHQLEQTEDGIKGVQLLEIISFMQPDNISYQLLIKFMPNVDISGPLNLLKRYSLITENDLIISVHRLVQQVTRVSVEQPMVEMIINSVHKIHPTLSKQEVVHAISIWNYASQNNTILRKYTRLPVHIAWKLSDLNMHDCCLNFARKFHSMLVEVLGPDPNSEQYEVPRLEKYVAQSLHRKGQYKGSLQIYERLVKQCESFLGEGHTLTLDLREERSVVVKAQNKLHEVVELLKVLSTQLQYVGSSGTLTTEIGSVDFVIKSGDWTEAMKILEGLYDNLKRTVVEEDTELVPQLRQLRAGVEFSMGVCFYLLGNYERARDVLQDVLNVMIGLEEMGSDHPNTLLTQYNLALTHYFLGEKEEAIKLMGEVEEKWGKVL